MKPQKNKSSAINYTLASGTIEIEYFTPIAKFRWLARGTKDFISYRETVLQQLHQGSNGTKRWEDVENDLKKDEQSTFQEKLNKMVEQNKNNNNNEKIQTPKNQSSRDTSHVD